MVNFELFVSSTIFFSSSPFFHRRLSSLRMFMFISCHHHSLGYLVVYALYLLSITVHVFLFFFLSTPPLTTYSLVVILPCVTGYSIRLLPLPHFILCSCLKLFEHIFFYTINNRLTVTAAAHTVYMGIMEINCMSHRIQINLTMSFRASFPKKLICGFNFKST